MKKKTRIILRVLAVLFVLGLGALCFAWKWVCDNKFPNISRSTVLYVYPETTADEVLETILDSCRVVRPGSLKRCFAEKKVAENIQPGRYEVKAGQTSVYIARMLNNCWQIPTSLVLSGTMRRKGDIARKIGNQLMVDSAAVAQALDDAELLREYGFTPQNVFSLILPDTYEMYWTASVEDILDRLFEEYEAFWTDERLDKARAQGLTKEEVSILASIVKGESNYEPELPSIAGVYLNRLHQGMLLQADPTVAFCYDYRLTRILNRHLEVDSPYNTYRHQGLPPGPICVPTKSCLEAVLNPDDHGYLYFCANSNFDGSHKFAVTYSQHLKNAHEFQQALNKRSRR